MRRILFIAGLVAIIPLGILVLVLSGTIKGTPTVTASPMTLRVWSTRNDVDAMGPLFKAWRTAHPYVQDIEFKTFPADGFFQQVLSGWAQGNGPDIVFVPNTWVSEMSSYATPMPADLSIPTAKSSGKSLVMSKEPAPSATVLHDQYVDAVAADTQLNGSVWGLPLSMDTLVLYSNKDLLNAAGIPVAATTWDELKSQVEGGKLTTLDASGNIVHAAVALGTAANIPHAADLLTLLMAQNGTPLVTSGQASFNTESGLRALQFYTSFGNPSKTTYSWNESQTNARDAFLQGQVAYYFGTLADRTLFTAASALNWGVTPMLHISANGDKDPVTGAAQPINAVQYDVMMVAKSGMTALRERAAWNLLLTMAEPAGDKVYTTATGTLSPLKTLLQTQQADPSLTTYARQLLTGRTWYHGKTGTTIDQAFLDLITDALKPEANLADALRLAADRVTSSL